MTDDTARGEVIEKQYAEQRAREAIVGHATPANPSGLLREAALKVLDAWDHQGTEAACWAVHMDLRAALATPAPLDADRLPEPVPGTYRTAEGGVEVIVGIEESASYVEDMFPDEVEYLTRALNTAAANVSDRRTLLDDGFWVSRKEMRALDLALGRDDIGAASPSEEPDR